MKSADKIAAAIALAGALIALAQFARPETTGRYSFRVSGDQIERFDTVRGEALICNRSRCFSADAAGTRQGYSNDDNELDAELNRQ